MAVFSDTYRGCMADRAMRLRDPNASVAALDERFTYAIVTNPIRAELLDLATTECASG